MAISFIDHANLAILSVSGTQIILDKNSDFASSSTDFLVNPARPKLTGGGGLDKVVHQAAGRSLKEACKKIPKENGVRCPTGEARLTHAGKLPSAYVLHTVGPKISSKVTKSDKKKLWKCYHNCMKLAEQRCSYVSNPKEKHHSYMSKIQSSKEHAFKCKLARDHASVTFPCISTGSYSYPANKAAKVAITSLVDFARHNTEGKVKEIHISCCKAQKDIPHLLHAMRTVK